MILVNLITNVLVDRTITFHVVGVTSFHQSSSANVGFYSGAYFTPSDNYVYSTFFDLAKCRSAVRAILSSLNEVNGI